MTIIALPKTYGYTSQISNNAYPGELSVCTAVTTAGW